MTTSKLRANARQTVAAGAPETCTITLACYVSVRASQSRATGYIKVYLQRLDETTASSQAQLYANLTMPLSNGTYKITNKGYSALLKPAADAASSGLIISTDDQTDSFKVLFFTRHRALVVLAFLTGLDYSGSSRTSAVMSARSRTSATACTSPRPRMPRPAAPSISRPRASSSTLSRSQARPASSTSEPLLPTSTAQIPC